MLQERYAPDKIFDSILKLTIKMDPELVQIDWLLAANEALSEIEASLEWLEKGARRQPVSIP
jgi:hypothetical protein